MSGFKSAQGPAVIRPEVTLLLYTSISPPFPPRRGKADMICTACAQTVLTQEAELFLERCIEGQKEKKWIAP